MSTLTRPALEDLLVDSLNVVFCGTAVGRTSARLGSYYAGPGNQFWATLCTTRLTPRQLSPGEFRDLPRYGIGLTDVCKLASGNDCDLERGDYDVGDFWNRIDLCRPGMVAFNGKQAAKVALEQATVSYGLQDRVENRPRTFVLPSTSGAARGYWDVSCWQELADLVNRR